MVGSRSGAGSLTEAGTSYARVWPQRGKFHSSTQPVSTRIKAPCVSRFNAERDINGKYAILRELSGLIETLKK